MKRIHLGAIAFSLSLLVAACGGNADQAGNAEKAEAGHDGNMAMAEMVTVSGTLVDTKCYGMNHENTGNDHIMPDGKTLPNCATACAGMGIPVAILEGGEKDGMVYTLVTPSMSLADHMAREARVSGSRVFENGLIPTKIEVMNAEGGWDEVSVATMM